VLPDRGSDPASGVVLGISVMRVRRKLGWMRRALRVLDDRRGAAAIVMALASVPTFAAIGLAVDSSMGYMLKSRMSKSLDAAALAAGRVALNEDADEVARAYFDTNFGEHANVEVTDFEFDLDETEQFVTLSAMATAPTYFMRIFGRDELTVAARSVIERETTGMELTLVLDVTGSMRSDGKFDAMKAAAIDLIKVIYGTESEIDNLWISLVPYVASVNIGTGNIDWLVAADRARKEPAVEFKHEAWRGCVEARTYPYDTDDSPPSERLFTSYYYPPTPGDNNDNKYPAVKAEGPHGDNARGPNLGCGGVITPLTSKRSTIDAALMAMQASARGGTTGNLGLSWGWRTISPRWRGVWKGETPATHPLDYDEPFMTKAVVILTDGENQFHDNSSAGPYSDYTAYGRVEDLGVSTAGGRDKTRDRGRVLLDGRMTETCNAMKAEGIRIYSITFGAVKESSKTLFGACATLPSMYHHAPTNAQLAKVFRAIGGELANLRIVE
jgi:Flp pilus assembly protein TadG